MPTTLVAYQDLQSKCTKARLVLPISVTQKRLLIVGEALGKDEEDSGDYFCGKAGQLFNKLLRESNLIRSAIHVTNVVKVRPPDNKLERLGELDLTVDDFIPYLKEEIEAVQPRAILALGATAMSWLTGKEGITKWRGSIARCTLVDKDIPVVITFHPSYIQRGQWHLFPYVRADFIKFAELGFGLNKTTAPFEMIIDPSLTQVVQYVNALVSQPGETAIDIETVNRSHITCIGLSNGPNSAICIPFRYHGLKLRWSKPEQLIIINELRKVYKNPTLTKIGQNFTYDMHYLLPLLGFPREPIFDTMLAHALIHPDARHDLGFIMSVYTDMPYHKDDYKDWASKALPHDSQLWEYNCRDCIGTHRSFIGLKRDLLEIGLYNFLTGYTLPFGRALFEMEFRGVNVDTNLRDAMAKDITDNLLPDAMWAIEELTDQPINPNSSKQVGTYLAEVLRLPIHKTQLGNYTVDEDHLEDLYARFPKHRRLMELIICARKMKAKDLGTYLTAPLSSDGRLRTHFGITKTGRLSSGENHKGEGTNLQNQPKRLRSIYIPDPGYVFLCPDLVGAEAFVTVWQAGSPGLKSEMSKGKKIHAVVCEWIYHKSPKELSPTVYRDVKSCVHGSNYKMGVNKFARVLGKTVAEAKVLRDRYYSVFPELPAYHSWVENEISTKRKLTTCYGRIRVFTGMIDKDDLYSAFSQIPQSTVADTINMGILGLWLVKPNDIHLLLQVHDEVVIQLKPERVEWFSPYIQAHLSDLRELWVGEDRLVIPVDIGGQRTMWYEKD